MMQVKKQAPRLKDLLEESNQFYQDLLGYKPEKTSLQSILESQWKEFAQIRGLNPNSSGIYLPRNQIAVIQEQTPLSLFHEYFGHGLYCEQSLSGRKLVDLEKKLLEEEKQEFKEKNFTLKDIQRFRQQNQTFQKLDEFRRQNLLQSETFAIFTEYFLSNKFEVKDKFNKKYDCLENKEKEAVDSAINFSQQHGDLATFYASGLARKTTQERVGKLLGEIYGSRLNDVKFALLYGSKKEFSDIDVFVVSDTLKEIKNNWLDVNVIESSEFEKELKLFDVEITHPISVGEFIFGDKNYLLEKRKQLKEQPITKEAIKHNLQEAEKQRRFAFEYPENSSERKIGLSYFLTSKLIAENLKQGKRVFTREKLLNSQSEINIQLKGGRIK